MKPTTIVIPFLLLVLSPAHAQKKDKQTIEAAPLPTAILTAKRLFIVNAGADDGWYDLFYSEMKSWGRYQLAGSPEEADLVFEFSFGSQGEAPQVYTNPANLRTYSYTVSSFRLVAYEPKNRTPIWSSVETPKGARLQKNATKEAVKSVKKMVENLKRRVGDVKEAEKKAKK